MSSLTFLVIPNPSELSEEQADARLLGGASGVNVHGGGSYPGYTPIADNSTDVIEIRPEFYGMMLFSLAGSGTLLNTQISGVQTNVSAFTVKRNDGGLSVVIVNKDQTQNLQLSVTVPEVAKTAQAITMTQLSLGAVLPSLSALSGVTVQNGQIDPNGGYSPSAPDQLVPSGNQVKCYVPALAAVLIQIS